MYERQNFVNGQVLEAFHLNHMEDELEVLSQALDDIRYEEIKITKFTVSPSSALRGSTVDAVTLTWAFNKQPQEILLDDIEQDLDSITVTQDIDLTANKSWTLKATDERDHTASATANLRFYNYVVYGVCTKDAEGNIKLVDDKITKTLSDNRARTINVNAGVDEYIVYAIPTRLGTPTFNVGGFEGGFSLHMTVSDQSWGTEYTEAYNYFVSTNPNLGQTKIAIS